MEEYNMKTYKVKYAVVTKSRCGSYVYKDTKNISISEDCENVKSALINYLKNNEETFKRFVVRIYSYEKVEE